MERQAQKIILLAGLICLSVQGFGQGKSTKPKTHVTYDTTFMLKAKVDYSPDTIPVYFKEIEVVCNSQHNLVGTTMIYETLRTGYIVWQTYRKSDHLLTLTSPSYLSSNGIYLAEGDSFYTVEYIDNSIQAKFLYEDRKTPVKNKVIYAVKR